MSLEPFWLELFYFTGQLKLETNLIYFTDEDRIMSLWLPRREGDSPKHFVVLRRGHVFVLEALVGEEPWTPFEIEDAFQKICHEADRLGDGPGVAALTRDPRDTWAENREYLMKLGEQCGNTETSSIE